jgi:hypothetical protein
MPVRDAICLLTILKLSPVMPSAEAAAAFHQIEE